MEYSKLYTLKDGTFVFLRNIGAGHLYDDINSKWYSANDVKELEGLPTGPEYFWNTGGSGGNSSNYGPVGLDRTIQPPDKTYALNSSNGIVVVRIKNISSIYQDQSGFYLSLNFNDGSSMTYPYASKDIRDYDANELLKLLNKNKEFKVVPEMNNNHENFFKSLVGDGKEFIRENKSVIYTVAMIFLVDHFIFEGAFREKLKNLVDALIGKVEKSIKGK